jgi:integrase
MLRARAPTGQGLDLRRLYGDETFPLQALELPLKLVSARLGHASIQMTADRYGHLFPSTDDGAKLAAAEKALIG